MRRRRGPSKSAELDVTVVGSFQAPLGTELGIVAPAGG